MASKTSLSLLLFCLLGVPSLQAQEPLKITQSIESAAAYMIRHCQPNGQFIYRINTNPNVQVAPKYNVLRHAGAIYALAQFHQQTREMPTERVLRRANDFLQSQAASIVDVPNTQAFWSDPMINGSDDPRRAKLGGTGLGLVALCEFEKLIPNSTSPTKLTELGNFLLFMQRDDGGFYSIYQPKFPGRDDSWTSLYYPGEAALGLLLLNDLVPDLDWVRGAKEALLFLARKRKRQDSVPADHWALIATEKLLSNRTQISDIERQSLQSHARQISRFMLSEQQPQNARKKLDGCFSPDGRTTPTATRLEGLLATLSILPDNDPLRTDVEDACHRGVRFLMRSQIKQGDEKGGLPRAFETLPKSHANWSPTFNARATEIRIDYVQHALSAWIRYRGLFAGRNKETQ